LTEKTVYLPIAKDWLAIGQEPIAACKVGNVVFTSGVPGIDRATGELGQGAEKQFELAFANLVTLLLNLRQILAHTQPAMHVAHMEVEGLLLSFRHLTRNFATDGGEFTFEIPHPCLTRVGHNNVRNGHL